MIQDLTKPVEHGAPARRVHPFTAPEFIALAAILLAVALLRSRLIDAPLERDEGDYALGGLELLRGHRLYADFYTMRLPGIYFAYAAILSVLGHTAAAIHWGALLVHLATTTVMYVAGRRLYGPACGLGTAAAFGVISQLTVLLGHTANSEHFLNFYAVAALAALAGRAPAGAARLVFAGAMMSAAFITKQHAAALVLAGCVWWIIPDADRSRGNALGGLRRSMIYFAGAALPLAITAAMIFATGAYRPFYHWVIEYAGTYAKGAPVREGIDPLKSALASFAPALWPFALLSLTGLVAAAREREARRAFIVVATYLSASLLMVCVGFYFRPHYFLLACPPLALCAGKGIEALCSRVRDPKWSRALGATTVLFVSGYAVAVDRDYFFSMSPAEVTRARYGTNPFPESESIAKYIAERSDPEDRVLVLGSEPQINFYADRRSATAYVYIYPLMEDQPYAAEMQAEFIAQAESSRPKYLLFISVATSWLRKENSKERILQWANDYAVQHYDLEAYVDIPATGVGVINLVEPGTRLQPHGDQVLILRRRED